MWECILRSEQGEKASVLAKHDLGFSKISTKYYAEVKEHEDRKDHWIQAFIDLKYGTMYKDSIIVPAQLRYGIYTNKRLYCEPGSQESRIWIPEWLDISES